LFFSFRQKISLTTSAKISEKLSENIRKDNGAIIRNDSAPFHPPAYPEIPVRVCLPTFPTSCSTEHQA
jgi:hypothetical protein